MRSLAVSAKDAAHGALLGACVGDAAGAVLEFESDISPAQVVRPAIVRCVCV